MRVLVLGAGKMTEAILMGLKKTENLSEWMIYSPSGISAKNLAAKTGSQVASDITSVSQPDWILIGCKPQQLGDLKKIIGDRFKGSLIVSMLAALSEADQKEILEAGALIRIMPNLPVAFNDGVTLLSSESAKERLSSFQVFFSKLGQALVVKEEELEELTLLTGSGPALFYEFARSLTECFSSLDQEAREKLVRNVIKGVSKNLSSSADDLKTLTDAVTSKGGVTIAVLESWRKNNLHELLKTGINAGKSRGQEIKATLRS